ncbi:TPA: hypothetical protein OUB66_001655 [Corynebacterium aurimucosum]|nr:hypothetical protein [Corynebacterium aurimucosum]
MDTATKMDGLSIPFLVSVNNIGGGYNSHDAVLQDWHPLVAPVLEYARRAGLFVLHDDEGDNDYFVSGRERERWFVPGV